MDIEIVEKGFLLYGVIDIGNRPKILVSQNQKAAFGSALRQKVENARHILAREPNSSTTNVMRQLKLSVRERTSRVMMSMTKAIRKMASYRRMFIRKRFCLLLSSRMNLRNEKVPSLSVK
jgi:hypothetical protein